MRNIFRIFKEHKSLIEENKILVEENERLIEENDVLIVENKILEAKYESLMQFKTNFDNFYNSISKPMVIHEERYNIITLNSAFDFIDPNDYRYPIERCKEEVVRKMCRQLESYIDFDIVDNQAYGTKSLVGKLSIVKK